MAAEFVLVGAGGFARETLDVIEASNAADGNPVIRVVGVVDDQPSAENIERIHARAYSMLGTVEHVLATRSPGQYVLAIGSPAARAVVAAKFDAAGWHPTTIIHPHAVIGSLARIGEGSVVCGGVQLSTNTALGRHVHLNPNVTVGHDSVIGDFTSVNPGAVVSGEVQIGSGVLIGAGAVILQRLSVREGSIVGASACVTRDVASQSVVVGVPARARTQSEARS